jgi:hypothetical protein
MWSRHSRRTKPTQRCANAFALVARTGVFATVSPSVGKTSWKAPENFEFRSRSRMCWSSRRPVIERFQARWVTQAESGRKADALDPSRPGHGRGDENHRHALAHA